MIIYFTPKLCFQDHATFMGTPKQLMHTREIGRKVNQAIPLSSLLAALDQTKLW